MFGDEIKIRTPIISFLGYVVIAVVVSGIVVQFWIPRGVTDVQELGRLAEGDPTLLAWQNCLGGMLALCAGFAVTQFSGAVGLKNSLVLGTLFVPYGVLGIYMHPSHSIAMQIATLVLPIPICLMGGWLRLRLTFAQRKILP